MPLEAGRVLGCHHFQRIATYVEPQEQTTEESKEHPFISHPNTRRAVPAQTIRRSYFRDYELYNLASTEVQEIFKPECTAFSTHTILILFLRLTIYSTQ